MDLKPREKSATNNTFLRLVADQPVKGYFRGKHYEFQKDFKGDGVFKKKYHFNLIVVENGALVSKIFEFGPMVYDVIEATNTQLKSESGLTPIERGLENYEATILKTGTGLLTEYKVTFARKPADEALLAKISAVALKYVGPKQPQKSNNQFDGESIPF